MGNGFDTGEFLFSYHEESTDEEEREHSREYESYMNSRVWRDTARGIRMLRGDRCEWCQRDKKGWRFYELRHPYTIIKRKRVAMTDENGNNIKSEHNAAHNVYEMRDVIVRRTQLEVHHKIYHDKEGKVFGRETPEMLLLLCPECHDEADKKRRNGLPQVPSPRGDDM